MTLVVASGLAGCSSDPAKSACLVDYAELTVPHQSNPKATPLLLLSDARLDAVAGGFVLLGSDGARVYWDVLGQDGEVVGDEQSVAVPAHVAGPWFAVAGINEPHDHLLLAYVPPDAPGTVPTGKRELMIASLSIAAPSTMSTSSSGPIAAGAEVAMRSGRAGMHAAITWAIPGQTSVMARVLGGDGVPAGADLNLGDVGDTAPGCLRFSAGKGDLTVGFVDTSVPTDPVFVASEIADDGSLSSPLRLRLGKTTPDGPGCVELVSSAEGYGVGWHSAGLGSYFGVYNPARPGFPSARILSDVRVSGMVPNVAGLGWLGKDYAVLFARDSIAEVWPVDANGNRQGALPVLPSAAGHIGRVSSQSVGNTLYATYADYAAAGNQGSGSRLLVKVTCP